MDPPYHHLVEKHSKHHSLTLNPLQFAIQNLFRKAVWLKRCAVLSSIFVQKLSQSISAVLEKKPKPLKTDTFNAL